MGTPPGWGLEHRVSVKNLTAIETSTIVKLLRPYVPVGKKRTSRSSSSWGVGHVGRMREMINAHKALVAKSEGKRPLGRRRWEDNIKMDHRK
jgi:hypothetical protein